MKKFAAIVATAGLLVAGGAATASAETMHRNGANKVTITADLNKKVPAGATVTKSRIKVKKGKKTVAKNKASYTAKKGSYKVTSTVTYVTAPTVVTTPARSVQLPSTVERSEDAIVRVPDTAITVVPTEDDVIFEQCVVTGYEQKWDWLQWIGTVPTDPNVWGNWHGSYTRATYGDCSAEAWNGQEWILITWEDEWVSRSNEYVSSRDTYGFFKEYIKPEDGLVPVENGNTVHYPGNGAELDKIPSIEFITEGGWTTIPGELVIRPGAWITVPGETITHSGTTHTVKSTRKVVVK